MKSALALCVLVSVTISFAPQAEAQDDDRGAERQRRTDEPSHEGSTETRRAVPDYDGRPPPGPPPEEVALWLPRALLAPLHFVFEYVVRRPLGWLLTTAERERWDIIQLLPFAQVRPTWGIAPTVLFDFGFVPSVGAYLWVDDILIPHNHFNVHLATGGPDWLRASVTDRQSLDEHTAIELAAVAWQRPDQRFYGIGPNARADRVARYGQRRIDVSLALQVRPWRASHLRVSMGVSVNELYDTDYLDLDEPRQRTLTDAVAHGWFPGINGLPGGWPGYDAYRQRLEGSIDTRRPEPESAGGVRAEGFVEHSFDLAQPIERRWVRWGGGAGAYVDIDQGRTIGLYSFAELASRLGPADVPFTELPDLGLEMRMPGFLPGWVRGDSAALAAIDYRYPVGPSLAGWMSVSMGNAFGPLFDDFALGLLRMSCALGLRTVGDPDQAFTMTIGIGTETIDAGLGVTSVRAVFGTQRGLF